MSMETDADSCELNKPDINQWLRERNGETFGSIYDCAMKTASYAEYEKWAKYLWYRYAVEVDNPFVEQTAETNNKPGQPDYGGKKDE